MLRISSLSAVALLAVLFPAGVVPVSATTRAAEPAAAGARAGGAVVKLDGLTLPAPGRISEIAATVMHPVERVLVKPGDRVRAGQTLIELDADEPRAEVRARESQVKELTATLAKLKAMPRGEERAQAKAELESAQIAARAAREYLERLESLRKQNAVRERDYIEQQTALRRAEADERAAQARLDYLLKLPIDHEIAEAEHRLAVAQAELEAAKCELAHYTIHAAIDGVVCRLDVTPGTVVRAGTKVWGEIVDLREVDVQVEMTPRQLREIDLSRTVRIEHADSEQAAGEGGRDAKFVYVAPAANRETGLIPVVLRVSQGEEPLQCHLAVSATFQRKDRNAQASSDRPAGERLLAR